MKSELAYKNASSSSLKAIIQNLILYQESLLKHVRRSHIVKGNCMRQQAAQLKGHLAKLLCASQPLNEGSHQGSSAEGCTLFGIQATQQSLPAQRLQAILYFQRQRREVEINTHGEMLILSICEDTGRHWFDTAERVSLLSGNCLTLEIKPQLLAWSCLHPAGNAKDQNLMAEKNQQTSPCAVKRFSPETHSAHAVEYHEVLYRYRLCTRHFQSTNIQIVHPVPIATLCLPTLQVTYLFYIAWIF